MFIKIIGILNLKEGTIINTKDIHKGSGIALITVLFFTMFSSGNMNNGKVNVQSGFVLKSGCVIAESATIFSNDGRKISFASTDNTDSLVIVAFGNSITAPRKTVNLVFAQRLPRLLSEKGVDATVINAGIPGSHTGRLSDNDVHKVRHASERFDSDVLSHQPDLVIIGFGTNDSFIDSYTLGGSSRISLYEYEENLTTFIETLQHQGIRVILIAPSPFGEKFESFHNDRLLQYVCVIKRLAERHSTGLVDNYSIFTNYPANAGEPVDSLLLDGSHPNDKGHKIIADSLVDEIIRIIENPY